MKIKAITVRNTPPVRHFAVDGLSDVCVLAGPNGVGKTRLLDRILDRILDTIDDASNAPTQYVQMCLAA